MLDTVSKKMKKARIARNLTVRAAANKAKCSHAYWVLVEGGHRRTITDKVIRMLKTVGLKVKIE